MRRRTPFHMLGIFTCVAIILVGLGIVVRFTRNAPSGTTPPALSGSTVHVVTAENFYGNIVEQLGGEHVQVTSFLSDPNVDPHEYEASVQDALAVHDARIVIENGLGYDGWMDKLLAASPSHSRVVLVAGSIAPHVLPENPHVWYGLENMPAIAQRITAALKTIDPAHAADYDQRLALFVASLQPLNARLQTIQASFARTPIGLTETIFAYQALAMSLDVLTPFAFQKAIAEGNDPAVSDVAAANEQIRNKKIRVLIYNQQTVTPLTTHLVQAADALRIPVIPVTETMPAHATYQSWMLDQLDRLEHALSPV